MLSLSTVFASLLLASSSFAAALPADSPHEALAILQGRAKCNKDNCLNALTNRAALATPFCTDYITTTVDTITITTWTSATATPDPQTITTTVGTSTSTVWANATFTHGERFQKRVKPTPITDVVVSACTSKPTADATFRISSACSCLLTPITTTVVSTSISTIDPVTETSIVEYAATTTVTDFKVVATIGPYQNGTHHKHHHHNKITKEQL